VKTEKQTSSNERLKRAETQSVERWLEVACECETQGNTSLATYCMAQAESLDQKTKES